MHFKLLTRPFWLLSAGRHATFFANRHPTLIGPRRSIANKAAIPQVIRRKEWTRALKAADELTGHHNFYGGLQLRYFENLGVFESVRNLADKTNNPLEVLARNFFHSVGDSPPIRGIVHLLASLSMDKPTNSSESLCPGTKADVHFRCKQTTLSEVIEVSHSALLVHKSTINLRKQTTKFDESKRKEIEDLNRISILFGNFVLGHISICLGKLENTEVLEAISQILRHNTEGEFVFKEDPNGVHYPCAESTFLDWENKSYLSTASTFSAGCRSIALLAARDEAFQAQAAEFGKCFGLAYQVYLELQSFLDWTARSPCDAFDLTSLPVILHLKRDPTILNAILPYIDNLKEAAYDKVHTAVIKGVAIQESKLIGQEYAQGAVRALQHFHASEAKEALEKMVSAMYYSY